MGSFFNFFESKDSLPANKSGPGITTPFWVWASAVPVSGKPRENIHEASGSGEGVSSPSAPAAETAGGLDAFINDLLAQHANMNAATFLNLLKTSGVTFQKEGLESVKKDPLESTKEETGSESGPEGSGQKEADASSGNSQFLRARESWIFRSTFTESAASDNGIGPTRFRVILLEEGLGNLRDGFYYTKEALKSAVSVFEGKKIYADHPSTFEDQTRPERSVRDVLGYFENMSYQEKDGRGFLEGDVNVMGDKPFEWARALLRHAVEFQKKHPDKEFVGLSINANGDAETKPVEDLLKESGIPESCKPKLIKARDGGLQNAKVVRTITEAVSCDLVTEAGAGGKVTDILESKSGKGLAAFKEENKMQKDEIKKPEGEEEKKVEGEEAPAAEHTDEDKDRKLIQDMLDKHLGKEEHSEETFGQAKEAYEAAMGEGCKAEEASDMVGHALKCSRIMKKHAEAKEAKAKEAAEAADKSKEAAPQESKAMESANIALKAENATLKERLAKIELDNLVEKELAASGLSRAVTKAFRECAGTIKNKDDFQQKFKVFVKAREAASGEADALSWITTEKQTSSLSGEALSLADCLK